MEINSDLELCLLVQPTIALGIAEAEPRQAG